MADQVRSGSAVKVEAFDDRKRGLCGTTNIIDNGRKGGGELAPSHGQARSTI